MSDDARLERIEQTLEDVLTYVVRLESRLQHAGVLTGWGKADDVLRYALENNMEREDDKSEFVPLDYQRRVLRYLDDNEKDPKASFYKMEDDCGAHFGHSERIKLIKCLQLFTLRGQFRELIDRMTNTTSAPIEAHGSDKNPYEDEYPKDVQ